MGTFARIALLLVVLGNAASCKTSGLPASLLQIANLSDREASVTWTIPGLVGTSLLASTHTQVVPACDSLQEGFDTAGISVTVVSAAARQDFVVPPLTSDGGVFQLVIGPDGSVRQVPPEEAPESPYCG